MIENLVVISIYTATIITIIAFFYGIFLPEKKSERKN